MASEEKPINIDASSMVASLIRSTTIAALIMGGIGATIVILGDHDFSAVFFDTASPLYSQSEIAAMGLLGAGLLLISCYFFADWFPSFRVFLGTIGVLTHRVPIAAAIYMAAISALAEELLFRAALQPTLGLELTAVIFALTHLGRDGPFSPWALWVFASSLVLGWLYATTGVIWCSMLTHFVFNLGLTLFLRSQLRRRKEVQATKQNQDDGVAEKR